MVDPSDIAGDVIAGATALAGLILVYLGSLATGFGGYNADQQSSVKASFQKRAWFAMIGLFLALVAAVMALCGKWFDVDCLSATAAGLLVVSFGWGIVTALLTVLEIR